MSTVARGVSTTPKTEPASACRDAQTAWSSLAEAISGQGRMRVSRDGGRTYPLHRERKITEQLPNQPAAVLIYDNSGCAHTFCIDLDVSKGGVDAVQRDYTTLTSTLRRLGLPHFADRSPNGGIHIYIPMAEPLPFHDAAGVARALEACTPTLDPMPMFGLTGGCIRPPGSRHKTGGHQELIGTPTAAWEATQHGATPEAWRRFATEVAFAPTDRREYGASRAEDDATGAGSSLSPLHRHNAPDSRYQAIARTGEYDTSKYATASEARQAVIWSAVAAGWTFNDVATRVANGTWPGLAALYARYRAGTRHHALLRDWKSAVTFEKKRRTAETTQSVRVHTTREPKTHRGDIYEQIRTWVNSVDLEFDQNRRDDLGARAVLMAMAEAAQKSQGTVISFGNRSLAVATGLDQSTVGKILKRLSAEDDPLVDLIREASGVLAHTYSLRVPDSVADVAGRRTWKRGKMHGVRPAFRELGLAAAFVYAALEQGNEPLSGREVAMQARVGVTTAHEALLLLEAFGLSAKRGGKWVLGGAQLDHLAERFGVREQVQQQLDRYKAERLAYWAYLGIIRLSDNAGTVGTYDPEAAPPPPPDNSYTLMDMLEDVLGAHLISETTSVA
jgi:hypothetical protein